MASKEVADLVRKAWKSIVDDPASWNQDNWIINGDCGTTFCLGGWMMIHSGFKVKRDERSTWFVDDCDNYVSAVDHVTPWVDDIYGPRFNGVTIFAAIHDTLPKLKSAIEAAVILDPIPENAPIDWGAQFDADIDFFVDLCVKAGDRITARQVRSDDILMGLLRAVRRNGRREGKAEVPANDGVLEAQHLLKIEQRHSEKLRRGLDDLKTVRAEVARRHDDRLKALHKENDELRRAASGTPKGRFDTLQKALRERTRQAREAGAAAREARALVQARDAEIQRLTALLDGQEGMKALRDLLADAERKVEILKIRMSLINNYSEIKGL